MSGVDVPGVYRTVVIEGCDGVGKTSLAGRLAAEHGFAVIHSPRTPDDVDLVARYRRILAEPGRLVLDRAFVSELVYGPLYRGRTRLPWDDAFDLVEDVNNRDGVFLHLTGSATSIAARLTARDQRAPDVAELGALIDAYTRVFTILAAHATVITLDIGTVPETVTPA